MSGLKSLDSFPWGSTAMLGLWETRKLFSSIPSPKPRVLLDALFRGAGAEATTGSVEPSPMRSDDAVWATMRISERWTSGAMFWLKTLLARWAKGRLLLWEEAFEGDGREGN